ncbi:MAG: hypothetical protein ACREJ4_02220 [Candidatus Methylomirabilaceae bacterium]
MPPEVSELDKLAFPLAMVVFLLAFLRPSLRRLLIPEYSELPMFLFGVTALLAVVTESGAVRAAVADALSRADLQKWILGPITAAMFIAGWVLSLYHVFTSRRKQPWEKSSLLGFAIMTNFAVGVAAAFHTLRDAHGLLALFPAWNLVSAMVLGLMWSNDEIPLSSIRDDNAPVLEVAGATVVMLTAFTLARFVVHLHAALTLSMCLAFATSLGTVLPTGRR